MTGRAANMGMNLTERILEAAAPRGDKPAVIEASGAVSYGALAQRIETARRELSGAGVGNALRVGLLADDSANFIAVCFGLMAAGAAVVPIPPNLPPEEQQTLARRVGLHAVAFAPGCPPADLPGAAVRVRPPRQRLLSSGFVLRWVDRDAPSPAGFAELNPAFVRFTSGTTGDSKGVVLSHATILDRVQAANAVLNIGPGDTILWVLPMAHHFAVTIVSYLLHGATIVLAGPPAEDAAAPLEAIRRHGATVLYGPPPFYRRLCDAPRAARLDTVRLALSTTASLPAQTARAFVSKYGVPVSNCYGLIEAGLPFINVARPRDKGASVGRATPGYEARIVGADGRPCPPGRTGDIHLRGPGLLDAYYTPWRTRAEILTDGWFHTGDVGRFDDEGFLTLAGRRGEIIACGGVTVFPTEIEHVLDAHPAVAESLVAGAADAGRGQVPVARVVLKGGIAAPPSESDLIAYCRARLSPEETPHRIEFVASLPRTPTGKLRRV